MNEASPPHNEVDGQAALERYGILDTPPDLAFCTHAILNPTELMVVKDTHQDERFGDTRWLLVNR